MEDSGRRDERNGTKGTAGKKWDKKDSRHNGKRGGRVEGKRGTRRSGERKRKKKVWEKK